jgi:hypothetical protein
MRAVLLLNTNSGTRYTFHGGVSLSKAMRPSRFQKFEPERHPGPAGCLLKGVCGAGLLPTPDPLTEILVTKIIDLCLAGECDSDRLCESVLAYFRAGEPTESGNG